MSFLDPTRDATNDGSTAARSETREYVTFVLGDEDYGVDINRVLEFIGYRPLSRIPNVPRFVKGVLNLRGTVVPVVDLREKLGLDAAECHKFTVIIILEVDGRTIGAVVDSVDDVVSLADADIQPPPSFDASIRTEFIAGMAERDDRFYILLDINQVFDVAELESGR